MANLKEIVGGKIKMGFWEWAYGMFGMNIEKGKEADKEDEERFKEK